jgi:hypothetical protein
VTFYTINQKCGRPSPFSRPATHVVAEDGGYSLRVPYSYNLTLEENMRKAQLALLRAKGVH